MMYDVLALASKYPFLKEIDEVCFWICSIQYSKLNFDHCRSLMK